MSWLTHSNLFVYPITSLHVNVLLPRTAHDICVDNVCVNSLFDINF
jgi:hypothetical protein